MPPKKPGIVTVPAMNYIAVRGQGNPNDENGEYKSGVGLLYGIAFTIKMSYRGTHKIDGYFQYVLPPLEGFWWQQGYELDITDTRYHHEIYLSDPRRCDAGKLKTVVRHPIKKL